MLRIKSSEIETVRSFLFETGYDAVLQYLRGAEYWTNPFASDWDAFSLRLRSLGKREQTSIGLLYCGERMLKSKVEHELGVEVVSSLISLGLLVSNGKIVHSGGYALIAFFGRFFIVDAPYQNRNGLRKDPNVYMGPDTYKLAKNIPREPIDRALDLCSGSGIQAILIADFASTVDAVEVNPVACLVAKFNIALNKLEKKVHLIQGSICDKVTYGQYDLIVANPPFIPLDSELAFSLAGHGGTDGLDVIREIVDESIVHLASGGKLVLIGESVMRGSKTLLEELVRKKMCSGFLVNIVEESMVSLDCYSERVARAALGTGFVEASEANDFASRAKDCYEKSGYTGVTSFVLKVLRLAPSMLSQFCVVKRFDEWREASIPSPARGLSFTMSEANRFYLIQSNGVDVSLVNEPAASFLRLCNGERSIGEILDILVDRLTFGLSGLSHVEAIQKLTEIASYYSSIRMIENATK